MASLTSSTQLLHDGSKAIGNTHSHAPASTVPSQTPRRGRPGTERAGNAGKGVCGQVAPNASRGPVRPQPAARPGLSRVPTAPGAHLLPPLCPAAAQRLRAVGPPESVAASAGARASRPRRPPGQEAGFPARTPPRPAPPRHSPPWMPPALLPGRCGPRPAWERCPPLGFRRAAWTPETSRSLRAPGPRPPGTEERS